MTNDNTTTTTTSSKTYTLDDEVRKFRATDDDLLAEDSRAHTRTDNNEASRPVTFEHPSQKSNSYRFVPLRMGGRGRTHVVSTDSAALIDDIGGLPTLEKMTKSFYDKAFRDATLDKLIRSHADPHGHRFATWIHQKLTGSSVWDEERATRSNTPVEVANGHTIVVTSAVCGCAFTSGR
mmetsp:Transcript_4688/g.7961  ORF Transcript_4688/g.7961 Transcript_4688/m.7961 type:complete len:179 (-) Transcript_4688:398-934(-)